MVVLKIDGKVHFFTLVDTHLSVFKKHYWDKSRNNLKIEQNDRIHFDTV